MTAIGLTAYPTRKPSVRPRLDRFLDRLAPYALLSPALLLFVVFVILPVLGAIALSFVSWDLLTDPTWTGFDNYRKLAHDHQIWQVFRNTVTFTVWSIVLHVVIGTALAVAVNSQLPRVVKYIARTTIFFPFLISWAAVSLIWKYAFDPTFGVFSYYGSKIGVPTGVLIDKTWAMPALILVDFWHTIGFAFVVLLAGLQAIPESLYEAARVDGANAWDRFWRITLPLLSPSLFFVTVINFIGAFQIFEPMFLMTQGRPGISTKSMVQYVYETAFRNFDVGYGAVLAIVVFAVVLVVTGLQFLLFRRWMHAA